MFLEFKGSTFIKAVSKLIAQMTIKDYFASQNPEILFARPL